MRPYYATAWRDIIGGLGHWRIWGHLGWQEIKRRYRRTALGPFWTTISIGMFVGGMGFIWAPLFKTDVSSYLPYLTAGMVCWTFVTALFTEGCGTYTAGVGLITQLNFPYTTLNYMVVWRNFIVLLHNLVILVIVVSVLPTPVNWNTLLILPGAVIVVINGAWITILLGIVSARFRDIPPLIGNLVTIMMFVTPIFWFSSQVSEGAQRYVVSFNYLFHLIDLIRAPMLGQRPATLSYAVTIVGGVVGWLVAVEVFARFRRRIPYWL